MNKNILLIVLPFITGTAQVTAQSVIVDAKMDSMQLVIGEQTKVHLQVAAEMNRKITFPSFHEGDTLVKGVEIVEVSKPDTHYLNNNQRLLIEQSYTITSFDSALYYLPPFVVNVDSAEYTSRPLSLKVYTVPVDTLHPEIFAGQKEQMNAPFEWSDWNRMIAGAFLTLPLFILLVYLIVRLRDNKPIIRKIKIEPKLPAHQSAMQEIERIKSEKTGQKRKIKEYYTELTDTLRNYLSARFQFNALEMTSSQIIEHLLEIKNKEALKELKELFGTADLVKFAKYTPPMYENDANLRYAIDFINETRQPDEELIQQPTEMTIIEKRTLRSKILLVGFIVVLSVAIIGVYIYVGMKLSGVSLLLND
ncbi:hypothetical protein EZS27_014295 [termite gut metagenome]|uniref:Protein BatD n=1 Tax=termite gut metagenome TaxID=433724 RepID=A0A5J4RUW4_9ZZZZ